MDTKADQKIQSSKSVADDQNTKIDKSNVTLVPDPILPSQDGNAEATKEDIVQKEKSGTKKSLRKTQTSKSVAGDQNTETAESYFPVVQDTILPSENGNAEASKEEKPGTKKSVRKMQSLKSVTGDQKMGTKESHVTVLPDPILTSQDGKTEADKEETQKEKPVPKKSVRKTQNLKSVDDPNTKTDKSHVPIVPDPILPSQDGNAEASKEETAQEEKPVAKKSVRKMLSSISVTGDQITETDKSHVLVLPDPVLPPQNNNAEASKMEDATEEKPCTKKSVRKTQSSKSVAGDQSMHSDKSQASVLQESILSSQEGTVVKDKLDTKKTGRKTLSSKCVTGDQDTQLDQSQASEVCSKEISKVFAIPDSALTIPINETKNAKKKSVRRTRVIAYLPEDLIIRGGVDNQDSSSSNPIQSSETFTEDQNVKSAQPLRASRAFCSVATSYRQDIDHPESVLDQAPPELAKNSRASRASTRRTTQATSIPENILIPTSHTAQVIRNSYFNNTKCHIHANP